MKKNKSMKILKEVILMLGIVSCTLIFAKHALAEVDPFIGEIEPFAGNFAPVGWAMCQGQLIQIQANTALFSLLGTTYGGDGRINFALPDLRGRIAIGAGQGPGLSEIVQGQMAGTSSTTETLNEMPAHSHQVNVSSATAITASPVGAIPAVAQTADKQEVKAYTTGSATGIAASASIISSGSSAQQNNMQPYMGINYIIAMTGIYPSRP